jgi:hypothetical protein
MHPRKKSRFSPPRIYTFWAGAADARVNKINIAKTVLSMNEVNDNKSHFKFETAGFLLTQERYDDYDKCRDKFFTSQAEALKEAERRSRLFYTFENPNFLLTQKRYDDYVKCRDNLLPSQAGAWEEAYD